MHSRFPRIVLALFLVPALATSGRAANREHVGLTVLSTTDLHGHIYPVDYNTNHPAELGLAKLATLIRRARQANPQLLLLDCGDTIQGTPLAYYHNRKDNGPVDPMMLVMNRLRYDALAVGNHEYNFGLPVLEKAHREAEFPWLSANTYRAGSDETAYPPYIMKEISGVRVAVIGLTTPGVPSWENPENYAGLDFRDPIVAARQWTDLVREKEHADVVIIAMHMGLEENLATGVKAEAIVPLENAAIAIARAVPRADLILMGHTHREVPALVVNGVLLAQADHWGNRLIRAEIDLERENGSAWRVVGKSSQAIPVTADVPADPEVLALARSYHEATQAWLDRPIGRSAKVVDAHDARLRDNALIDLIQRVQLEAGNAEVSLAASFNPEARLPAGPVTVREIAALYPYENTLATIELTGAQLKAALEHSTRYFRPYQPGKTPEELIDPQIPGYQFDLAEGVDYTIDLTRPLGERIVDLKFHGQPLDPARKFRVAINNYRLNGGGGYTMYKGVPVLFRSSTEIRELVIEWVGHHPDLATEPTNNWRMVAGP
jgi:2',3'-cyclic-nucleotide 2'-phosphodiesterase/3'-nucleotidase